jgi:hypothetical protein
VVPALLVSQMLCGGRCPLDPLTWRTTRGTSHAGCKAVVAPALPYVKVRLRGIGERPLPFALFPHLLAIVGVLMVIGSLRFDSQSHHGRVRDVRILGVWLTLTTRPCPHQAWSHARC